MRKKRKIIYIGLIIVLVVPVILFYNAFNGNPLSKQLSKHALQQYLETEYPGADYTFSKPFYNFKDNGYNFTVKKVGDESGKEFDFNVSGNLMFTVTHDGIYYDRLDEKLMEKLGNEASESIWELIEADVPELYEITVQLEVLAGMYDEDTVWTPEFEPEQPMHVNIVIRANQLSKERLLDLTKTIQQRLKEENCEYDYIMINANAIVAEELDALQYAISFKQDTKITEKMIEQFD